MSISLDRPQLQCQQPDDFEAESMSAVTLYRTDPARNMRRCSTYSPTCSGNGALSANGDALAAPGASRLSRCVAAWGDRDRGYSGQHSSLTLENEDPTGVKRSRESSLAKPAQSVSPALTPHTHRRTGAAAPGDATTGPSRCGEMPPRRITNIGHIARPAGNKGPCDAAAFLLAPDRPVRDQWP
jgi:hypothetical protein